MFACAKACEGLCFPLGDLFRVEPFAATVFGKLSFVKLGSVNNDGEFGLRANYIGFVRRCVRLGLIARC